MKFGAGLHGWGWGLGLLQGPRRRGGSCPAPAGLGDGLDGMASRAPLHPAPRVSPNHRASPASLGTRGPGTPYSHPPWLSRALSSGGRGPTLFLHFPLSRFHLPRVLSLSCPVRFTPRTLLHLQLSNTLIPLVFSTFGSLDGPL